MEKRVRSHKSRRIAGRPAQDARLHFLTTRGELSCIPSAAGSSDQAGSSPVGSTDPNAPVIQSTLATLNSCEPASYYFYSGTPPYSIWLIETGYVNAPVLKVLPVANQAETSQSWGVDIVPGSNVTFVIKDAEGLVAYSRPVMIQKDTDSDLSCLASAAVPPCGSLAGGPSPDDGLYTATLKNGQTTTVTDSQPSIYATTFEGQSTTVTDFPTALTTTLDGHATTLRPAINPSLVTEMTSGSLITFSQSLTTSSITNTINGHLTTMLVTGAVPMTDAMGSATATNAVANSKSDMSGASRTAIAAGVGSAFGALALLAMLAGLLLWLRKRKAPPPQRSFEVIRDTAESPLPPLSLGPEYLSMPRDDGSGRVRLVLK